MYLLGRDREHHVAGRHRHLDRRPGGRRDRRGGERLQETGALAGRRARRAISTKCACEALKEVGPSVFFSLLVIAVAFLPIFTLGTRKGGSSSRWPTRRPWPWPSPRCWPSRSTRRCGCSSRGWTGSISGRTGCRGSVNQVAVGRYYREEKHPVSRVLFRLYEGPCRFVLRHRVATVIVARPARAADDPGLSAASAASSCRRSGKATCSTCRRRCRASR